VPAYACHSIYSFFLHAHETHPPPTPPSTQHPDCRQSPGACSQERGTLHRAMALTYALIPKLIAGSQSRPHIHARHGLRLRVNPSTGEGWGQWYSGTISLIVGKYGDTARVLYNSLYMLICLRLQPPPPQSIPIHNTCSAPHPRRSQAKAFTQEQSKYIKIGPPHPRLNRQFLIFCY